MSDFDRAFAFVVGEEGGYVNDPNDPGGETKFGISKRAYPDVDILNLTEDAAKAIYLRDYWTPLQLDGRPYGIAVCMFDCAVNQGVGTARALYVKANSGGDLLVNLLAERAVRYGSLMNFPLYGRGWMRRLFRLHAEATREPS